MIGNMLWEPEFVIFDVAGGSALDRSFMRCVWGALDLDPGVMLNQCRPPLMVLHYWVSNGVPDPQNRDPAPAPCLRGLG